MSWHDDCMKIWLAILALLVTTGTAFAYSRRDELLDTHDQLLKDRDNAEYDIKAYSDKLKEAQDRLDGIDYNLKRVEADLGDVEDGR
jgi:peptidoglycan hydrolase CwlO-like protein